MKQTANKVMQGGLMGAVALAGATQAYGAVVNWNPANIVPTSATTSPSKKAFYDIDGNGTNDIEFGYFQSASNPNEFFAGVYLLNGGAAAGYLTPYSTVYTYPLATGSKVGADAGITFNQYAGRFSFMVLAYNGTTYGFTASQPNTVLNLGFQFTENGNLLNGYVSFEADPYVSASQPGGLLFHGGAYESTVGTDITVGAQATNVPEPGTLSALAVGAAGLAGVGFRRRRKAAAAQD